jgi:hypothetical protein
MKEFTAEGCMVSASISSWYLLPCLRIFRIPFNQFAGAVGMQDTRVVPSLGNPMPGANAQSIITLRN